MYLPSLRAAALHGSSGNLAGPVDTIKTIQGKYTYYVNKLGHAPSRSELLKIEDAIYADMHKGAAATGVGGYFSMELIHNTIGVMNPIDTVVGATRTVIQAPFKAAVWAGKAGSQAVGFPTTAAIVFGAIVIFFGPGMLARYGKARI